MKRYFAILGMVTLLALPTAVLAEVNDQPIPVQRMVDAGRLADLLARKGVITEQELAEVAPVTTAPEKKDQQSGSSNPYLQNGLLW